MRKALIVGIDYYPVLGSLSGCVSDAVAMDALLRRNDDMTVNFNTRLITGPVDQPVLERRTLKQEVRRLFADESEIALFYYAGHGFLEDVGGYLITGECEHGDDGLSVAELMTLASSSPARNRVIILDSCHSGFAGNRADSPMAELREGTTILTASTSLQNASERDGHGIFTGLLIDALQGGAANLVGDVTVGSIYAHIDRALGPWAQRPVFKANVKNFMSLRRAQPAIPLSDLQSLPTLFPDPNTPLPLDPAYEPNRNAGEEALPLPDPAKNAIFKQLQRMVANALVVPDGSDSMYYAAMGNKGCRLTALGRHYHQLASNGCI
ncbi:MAG: caspase family protein [Sphingomonadales bacterium]|jgi:hypothetical protein